MTKKKHRFEYYILYRKKLRKKNKNFRLKVGTGSIIPGSGSADPDPHQKDVDPKHCI